MITSCIILLTTAVTVVVVVAVVVIVVVDVEPHVLEASKHGFDRDVLNFGPDLLSVCTLIGIRYVFKLY